GLDHVAPHPAAIRAVLRLERIIKGLPSSTERILEKPLGFGAGLPSDDVLAFASGGQMFRNLLKRYRRRTSAHEAFDELECACLGPELAHEPAIEPDLAMPLVDDQPRALGRNEERRNELFKAA